jgi:putative transposase
LIESENSKISLRRQCQLLGLNRSNLYYQPVLESQEDLQLKRLLDEQYTRTPFYGVNKMTVYLRELGWVVNEKRVRRLLREMGLMAIYPKPCLSQANSEHPRFPYLLKDVLIERVNQVWSTDITYIRLTSGFCYLVAVMDWFSRYVLAHRVSNNLETGFCLEALDEALLRGRPEIFNSDLGSQFTSLDFVGRLRASGIGVSHDGRGRCFDNIFNERLWRTVKYEEVYVKDYRLLPEAQIGLRDYFKFYNGERFHQSLSYKTPESVFRQGINEQPISTLI